MFNYNVVFENAWYLLLLVPLLPAVWWLSRGSLGGLGRLRRMLAIGLRMAVLLLIVAALAGMQLEKSTNRVTVIYLLDQSLSIPQDQRQAMLDYVNEAVRRHHRESSEDKVGVIVFGRDAAVEYPPADFFAGLAQVETTDLDPEHTDLAGAMKRAMAMFTGDYAKRIVVVSDGNENVGDARRQARALADASVSIDVWPVFLPARNEISVEKVAIPADVRRDQPFDLRVVVNNETSGENPNRTVRGKLRIVRKTGERDETIAEQDVELPPASAFCGSRRRSNGRISTPMRRSSSPTIRPRTARRRTTRPAHLRTCGGAGTCCSSRTSPNRDSLPTSSTACGARVWR